MGGQAGGKGYLVQALVALLDSLRPGDGWDSVTIEPNDESEKVDILWHYPSRRKAVQVKHSQHPITKPMVQKWATELETTSKADDYSLVLLGPCVSKLTELRSVGSVLIPTPMTVNIEALRFQAAHLLDGFLRAQNPRCVTSPGARELIVDALTTRLSKCSTDGTEIARRAFELLLSSWIEEIDPSLACFQKSVSAELRGTYCHWVQTTFATFYVPGLNVSLPIEQAWVQLRAMRDNNSIIGTKVQLDEQLRNYLEFGIRQRNTDGDASMASDLLPSMIPSTVLVGGPGSGKSTALKRFAWRMSSEGMVVIHVRLPLLTQLINNGMSFDEGVVRLALDGSGIEEADRRQLFEAADLLLCDGLDECDPHRPMISQKLIQWSIGHPKCRVCVSTRPVGHEIAFLPNFSHYALIPPTEHQIRDLANILFRECSQTQNPDVNCAEFLATIESKRRASPAKKLASQNPLLLGFLIKLHMDGINVGNSRCNLYGSVFRLMLRTKPNDRNAIEINERVALAVIHSLAWKLTESPFEDFEATVNFVVKHIQSNFELTVMDAEKAVLDCIRFWEERRLLETVTVGVDRKTFFVHLSLQEFAAAQFAFSLTDDQFMKWITKVRRLPAWTQVILLVCGLDTKDRTIAALLELDAPTDAISREAVLAASGFLESDAHERSTMEFLVNALRSRVASDVPLVSLEASLALAKLAGYSREEVGQVVSLWRADTAWAAMGLLLLRLATEDSLEVVHEFKQWFLEYEPIKHHFPRLSKRDDSQFIPEEGREVQNEIIRIGMERLFATPDVEAIDAYFNSFSELGNVSAFIVGDLQRRLADLGLTETAKRLWPPNFDLERMTQISDGIARWEKGKITLLRLILSACGPFSNENLKPPFHGLSKFFAGINFWNSTAGAIGAMENTDPNNDAVGGELIRAIAIAMGIEFADLAAEAKCAIQICEEDTSQFLDLIEPVDVECQWSQLLSANLNKDLIAAGLLHCFSLFSVVAAKIIHSGIATGEARNIIPKTLDSEFDHSVHLGALLSFHCCGCSAADILLDRLKRPIRVAHSALFDVLAEKGPFERHEEIKATFVGFLKCRSPKLAAEVTEALGKLRTPIGDECVSILRDAYDEWRNREEKEVSSQEELVQIVSDSPRPGLLKLLDQLGDVTLDEWLLLTEDGHSSVSSLAKATVLKLAADNELVLKQVFSLLQNGKIRADMIDQLLKLPIKANSSLAKIAESLLLANDLNIRLATMAQLTGDWIQREKAIAHLQAALLDESPAVRTLAVRILRLFR